MVPIGAVAAAAAGALLLQVLPLAGPARAAWCWDASPPKCVLSPGVAGGSCQEGAEISAGGTCTPVCEGDKVPSGSCTVQCPPSGGEGCFDDATAGRDGNPWWNHCSFGSSCAGGPWEFGTAGTSMWGQFSCVEPGSASGCHANYYKNDCHWGDDDWEDFFGRIAIGSIIASVIAVILIVVSSLPACCGIMKESNLCVLGTVVGIVAALLNFVPALTAAIVTDASIDHHCDNCGGCDDADHDAARDVISLWAAILAYAFGLGFLPVILATVAEVLACIACCQCCGPLKAYKDSKAAAAAPPGPVAGQVVGAPMGQPYNPSGAPACAPDAPAEADNNVAS